MRAAVWEGRDELVVREVPTPVPGPGEALVKVRVAGVCATDYHIISGKLHISTPPHIQGHEICGEVATGPLAGIRCVVATSVGCGTCEYCRQGLEYLCAKGTEIGYTPRNGGYAEYVKVPERCVVPLPDGVSDEQAGILESVVCPTESLLRIGVKPGASAVVCGAGPAGLAYVMLARKLGAGRVVCLVRRPDKNEIIRACGATDIVNLSEPSAAEQVLELTGGEGADLCVDAVGNPEVTALCVACAKRGGKVVLYGIPGEHEKLSLSAKTIVMRELTLYGAVGNTKAWRPLIGMLERGELDLSRFVTHRFPLERINEAFDLYRNHDRTLIKAIIDMRGEQK